MDDYFESPGYLAMRKNDMEREQRLSESCSTLADALIAAAGELHWYSDDPFEAAIGWIESARMAAQTNEPSPPAVRKRKKLPSRAVWDRDGWRCVQCQTYKHLTVDHIVPWSLGGSDEMDNLQTLCVACNSSKGART